MDVYCVGTQSYEERESLPCRVFSTLEAAMAHVAAPVELPTGTFPGRHITWEHDGHNTWTEVSVSRGAAAWVIRRYVVDDDDE